MSAADRAVTRRIPNPKVAGSIALAHACQTGRHPLSERGLRALDLAQQADAILKRANCDTVTGAKQDRKYRRNKSAARKRFARLARARSKKLGKFGAASPVRNIPPDVC